MDSLTQIVLGAAVGEVVLGKKVGNRAILWGAIAGTIPDLDVLAKLFFDDLTANELHRGPTHSILFCLIASPLLAWWLKRHRRSLLVFFIALLSLVFMRGAELVPQLVLAGSAILISVLIWRRTQERNDASFKDWTLLFWWALVTHPILDCHTTWGTQLLWPLPVKFAWNNIFVVDPLYTLPFLVCVIAAMFYKRTDPKRRILNRLGIVLSSTYMLITLGLKWKAHTEVADSLDRQRIDHQGISTRPTPFNSILWSVNVNLEDRYKLGLHSLFDTKPEVELVDVPKNHDRLGKWEDHPDVQRLIRLADDNYVISERNDTLIFNDLRFGQMGDPHPDKPFVFSYKLIDDNGALRTELIPPPRPDAEEMGRVMLELYERMKGE